MYSRIVDKLLRSAILWIVLSFKSRRAWKDRMFLEEDTMLVLCRKKNESIVINNDITVTVVEIRGDKVRLGIVAPKEVPVHRQEVNDAIYGKPDVGQGDIEQAKPA